MTCFFLCLKRFSNWHHLKIPKTTVWDKPLCVVLLSRNRSWRHSTTQKVLWIPNNTTNALTPSQKGLQNQTHWLRGVVIPVDKGLRTILVFTESQIPIHISSLNQFGSKLVDGDGACCVCCSSSLWSAIEVWCCCNSIILWMQDSGGRQFLFTASNTSSTFFFTCSFLIFFFLSPLCPSPSPFFLRSMLLSCFGGHHWWWVARFSFLCWKVKILDLPFCQTLELCMMTSGWWMELRCFVLINKYNTGCVTPSFSQRENWRFDSIWRPKTRKICVPKSNSLGINRCFPPPCCCDTTIDFAYLFHQGEKVIHHLVFETPSLKSLVREPCCVVIGENFWVDFNTGFLLWFQRCPFCLASYLDLCKSVQSFLLINWCSFSPISSLCSSRRNLWFAKRLPTCKFKKLLVLCAHSNHRG